MSEFIHIKRVKKAMLTHVGTKQIETERLILRRFEFSDCNDMLKYWVSDPEIQSLYCEPAYTTEQDVTALIGQYIDSCKASNYYRWAIVAKDTMQCIGQIAYFLVDEQGHFAEMEYCIGNDFQKRGLATEATKAVIKYGFEEINLHKVQICHKSLNMPSKRVIEKCGLTFEGALRDFFYQDGHYVDRLYYSILQAEYESHRQGEKNGE